MKARDFALIIAAPLPEFGKFKYWARRIAGSKHSNTVWGNLLDCREDLPDFEQCPDGGGNKPAGGKFARRFFFSLGKPGLKFLPNPVVAKRQGPASSCRPLICVVPL
jgi:hypothetical protein